MRPGIECSATGSERAGGSARGDGVAPPHGTIRLGIHFLFLHKFRIETPHIAHLRTDVEE